MADIIDMVSQSAGENPSEDRYRVGIIRALREIKDIEFVR